MCWREIGVKSDEGSLQEYGKSEFEEDLAKESVHCLGFQYCQNVVIYRHEIDSSTKRSSRLYELGVEGRGATVEFSFHPCFADEGVTSNERFFIGFIGVPPKHKRRIAAFPWTLVIISIRTTANRRTERRQGHDEQRLGCWEAFRVDKSQPDKWAGK